MYFFLKIYVHESSRNCIATGRGVTWFKRKVPNAGVLRYWTLVFLYARTWNFPNLFYRERILIQSLKYNLQIIILTHISVQFLIYAVTAYIFHTDDHRILKIIIDMIKLFDISVSYDIFPPFHLFTPRPHKVMIPGTVTYTSSLPAADSIRRRSALAYNIVSAFNKVFQS